ncbi:Protein of unknown function [Lactobacillus helveticus CIRM-BIA 101]|uniref:Uncharacterized protein n=1 Tax=Lactobacillus helveticus CIRM-BIA 104 TaxID=1226333 RepID=U6F6U5_LACHE|nr:Protein of unknown function [Lactobacillus helveticus CIRM-BIA 104]CDI62667.1 Protein of unknown function [Lactobacillus helveticus CIRM-BIA 103]CDI65443.1 Protein of unknown function [Lactobacillus helveticus CIRM-BIA 101]
MTNQSADIDAVSGQLLLRMGLKKPSQML